MVIIDHLHTGSYSDQGTLGAGTLLVKLWVKFCDSFIKIVKFVIVFYHHT